MSSPAAFAADETSYTSYPSVDQSVYDVLQMELDSDQVFNVNDRILPGLLQTEQYARALLTQLAFDNDTIEQGVALRMERQQRFFSSATTGKLTVVLDEAVFLRPAGDESIMHEQLQHILYLCSQNLVQLYIYPMTGGLSWLFLQYHFGLWIFKSYKNKHSDLQVFTEAFHGAHEVFGANDFQAWHLYRNLLSLMHNDCLSPQESVAYLERLADVYLMGTDVTLAKRPK